MSSRILLKFLPRRASWSRLSVTAMLTETSESKRRHGRTTVWLDSDLLRKHWVMIDPDGAGTGRFHCLNCCMILELMRELSAPESRRNRTGLPKMLPTRKSLGMKVGVGEMFSWSSVDTANTFLSGHTAPRWPHF